MGLFVFSTLRESFLKDAVESDALTTLSSLITLMEQMEKNEVRSEYHLRLVFSNVANTVLLCFNLHELQADFIPLNYCLSDLQWLGAGPWRLHGDSLCFPAGCSCSLQTVLQYLQWLRVL